jgi:hypothetical protein
MVGQQEEISGRRGGGGVMGQDPYDLDKLRVDPAKLRRKSPKPKKWRRHFVQFPFAWHEQMRAVRGGATYRLALLLLYEHWRAGGRPVVLSNILCREEGLSRWAKWRALTELRELGLVRVEHRGKQAPRVVVRHASPK